MALAPSVLRRAPARASTSAGAATTRPDAGHLPGLDGLRALAVIAVLIFHLRATWLPGGFLGVDVFFVVSGFLITTLLLREVSRTGRVDLKRFWLRRARRLLPALTIVVVVATLAARFVEADLLVGIGRQTLGALTFSTNWLEIGAGSDYFHATSPQLFMNFWSLAVEEQFYLFWPLVVLVIVRLVHRRRRRMLVPLAIGLASALAMIVLLDPASPTRVYYGTDTHLIGLMLGAALAFAYAAPHRAWTETPAWARLHAPLTAWALVILLTLFVTSDESSATTFRLGIPLASLATAVLILSLVSTASMLRRTAQFAPLVWIGERSYGIYLWHWPVVLIVGALWQTVPGSSSFLLSRAACVLLTLALAEASHRFVETPIRQGGFRAASIGLRSTLDALTPRGLRAVTATAVVLTVAYAAILATAPLRTSTETMLAANARQARSAADTSDETAAATTNSGAASGNSSQGTTGDAPADGVTAQTAPPAAAAPTGPPTAAEKATVFAMPTGAEIDAYGDSMLVGSIPAMKYYFNGIRLDARSNRQWAEGLAAVQAKGADNRRAVVLALGTNAGTDRAALEKAITALGPRRMIVLVTEHGGFARVASDNAALREVAAAHENVALADWDAALQGTSGQLQSDGIHPSRVGQHLFAKTVRAAFAELTTRHTGTTPELPELPIP